MTKATVHLLNSEGIGGKLLLMFDQSMQTYPISILIGYNIHHFCLVAGNMNQSIGLLLRFAT